MKIYKFVRIRVEPGRNGDRLSLWRVLWSKEDDEEEEEEEGADEAEAGGGSEELEIEDGTDPVGSGEAFCSGEDGAESSDEEEAGDGIRFRFLCNSSRLVEDVETAPAFG